MGLIKERISLMKGMDQYIRNASTDEEDGIFDTWIAEGIPDGADNELLEEIARNTDSWVNICKLFGELVDELEGV